MLQFQLLPSPLRPNLLQVTHIILMAETLDTAVTAGKAVIAVTAMIVGSLTPLIYVEKLFKTPS
jgi:uncharacterized membrane protein